jgi:nitrite reductase (NADH) small subunit
VTIGVGRVQDFPDRQVSMITVGRSEIGIVRWNGSVYAIGAVCAHQGGPLCRGILAGRLGAVKPGDMALDGSAPVIACPWHGWEFDVGTGEAIWDSSLRIRTYPVRVIDGRIFIETNAVRGSLA